MGLGTIRDVLLEFGRVRGEGRKVDVNAERGRALIWSRERDSVSGLEVLGEVEWGGEEADAVVGGEGAVFSLLEEGGWMRRLFEGREGRVIVDLEVESKCIYAERHICDPVIEILFY